MVLLLAGSSTRIITQYERGVVLRFGQLRAATRGPGLTLIAPIADRLHKVNMQIVTMPVPAQEGITRDNVTVRVDAVVYYRFMVSGRATSLTEHPAALQLRLLQTVVEVAAEKNSTLVLPFPVELLRFLEHSTPPEAADALARTISPLQKPSHDKDVLDEAEDQLPSREATPHSSGLSELVVTGGPELITTPGREQTGSAAPTHSHPYGTER